MAVYLGWPMPYLLGSLLVSAVFATFMPQILPRTYSFPNQFRAIFIAVIGLAIGAQVTLDLFKSAGVFVYSFSALIVFVVLAQGFNYAIFRKFGKYDPPTAFYSGAPGGLYESIALGEVAGADLSVLMLQQFLRIILVVSLIPIGFSWWYGAPVGSASGLSLANETLATPLNYATLAVVGWLGLTIAKVMHFPAPQLIGPIAAAAFVNLTGVAEIIVPSWAISVAQLVIGTALGMRFNGMTYEQLLRGIWLSFLSVSGMLVIGFLLSLAILPFTGQTLEVLLISFAPGGVTEMTLVALSLAANPAFVTLHHLFRIIVTVILLSQSKRFFEKPDSN